jgi:WD40 repeat protein
MKLSLPGRIGATSLVIMIVVVGSFACGNTVWNAINALVCSTDATKLSTHTTSDVAWSADGARLISRSRGGNHLNAAVAIHDLSGQRFPFYLWYSDCGLSANHATLSPDGNHLLLATSHGELWWVQIDTGNIISLGKSVRESFVRTEISPSGNILAGALGDGQIYLYDRRCMEIHHVEKVSSGSMIRQLQFSADDRRLLAVCSDGSMHIGEVDRGALLLEMRFEDPAGAAAAFLPDGNSVLSAGRTGRISIWSVSTGLVAQTKPHGIDGPAEVQHMDVSKDGSIAALAGFGNRVAIWELQRFEKRLEFENPSAVHGLRISPDGRQLAVAGRESYVRIYDTATGSLTQRIEAIPGSRPE